MREGTKMMKRILSVLLTVCLTSGLVPGYGVQAAGAASEAVITTVAGNGTSTYSGDEAAAVLAGIGSPEAVAVDAAGNIYIADTTNNRIRKVDAATGIITTVAGAGDSGDTTDGAAATSARLYGPIGVAVDNNSNIFITEYEAEHLSRIRMVNVYTGYISTVAGGISIGYSGDGGYATSAELNTIGGVAVDTAGNIYIADSENNRIRKVDVMTGCIATVAGNGNGGSSGDGGLATDAELSYPTDIAVDSAGNIYIADYFNNRIRKVGTDGKISTVAGTGTEGYSGDGGLAVNAEIKSPNGIDVDIDGNIYFASTYDNRIRKVDTDGIISTVAGNGTGGFLGDGSAATLAELSYPRGVAVDSNGIIFIADTSNNRIRRVGPPAVVDSTAPVLTPGGVTRTSDTAGTVKFTSDEAGQYYYAVVADGEAATTIDTSGAGTDCTTDETTITNPEGLTAGVMDIYIKVKDAAGNESNTIKLDIHAYVAPSTDIITTVAGNGTEAYSGDGAAAVLAGIGSPEGVAVDAAGNIYIADIYNNRIRKVDAATGNISTVAGAGDSGATEDGVLATSARLYCPEGLAVDNAGNIFISEYDAENLSRIRKVDAVSGIITTVAGGISIGYSGDGGLATSAQLQSYGGVAVDDDGNIYIADSENNRVRKVDTSGIITTVAGNGIAGYSGDGGLATAAQLNVPLDIAVDTAGNIFISDYYNNVIRKVDAGTGKISTVAGDGTGDYSGDGGLAVYAQLDDPQGIDVDTAGNIYIADIEFNVIRKVDTDGYISTVAGTGSRGYSGDGSAAILAELCKPKRVAVDKDGNIYISDNWNSRIRKVGPPDTTAPVLKAGAVDRTSDTAGTVKFTSNEAGSYYYAVVADGAAVPSIDTTGAGTACTTDETIITNPIGLTAGAMDIYIKVKDAAGNVSSAIKIDIAAYVAPDTTAPALTAGTVDRTSDTVGTVKFTSNEAGQYYYAIVVDGATAPTIDTSGTGTACTASEITITNPTGLTAGAKDIYIKVKDAADNVSSALKIDIAAYVAPSSGGGDNSLTPPDTGADILVNGKTENAGTAINTKEGDKTVTTIVVDQTKLEQKLSAEGNNAVVTIPVKTQADVVVGELNGQMIKNMETKDAVLKVKTDSVSYVLPAGQINIDAVSEQIGQNIKLKDIKVQIKIEKSTEETVKIVENSAKKGEFTVIAPPVDFTVKCMTGDKTVSISKFNAYVERTIAIPEGVDPNKITTGIVIDPDGRVRHVPTCVTVINGTYYAVINSLTNSTYSVVWHPLEFKDAAKHWAKDAINDMGSRMVISGVGNDTFEPDRDITRAEFAAIIVRALGLKPGTGKNPFSDVSSSSWYCEYIQTATEYGIIAGYGNGKFGPMDKITREQAMAMIARAMKITELKADLKAGDADGLLKGFGDSEQAASWAKENIAACVKTGIVSGKNGKLLAPKDEITRAEVALIVRNLLQKSNLI